MRCGLLLCKNCSCTCLRAAHGRQQGDWFWMQAPMLYCGENIGSADEPKVDIAVDPLDGTSLVAQGRDGAISVIAMAERGALFDPGPCMYGCYLYCFLGHEYALLRSAAVAGCLKQLALR